MFGVANTSLELKMLSDLFSMAPMLKSSTATMLKMFRSYSSPYVSSSHFIALIRLSMAKSTFPTFSSCTKIRNVTSLPDIVLNVSSRIDSLPATNANR